MGSDTTKAHEALTVAPGDPDGHSDEPIVDCAEANAALDKLAHTFELIEGLSYHGDPDHLHADLGFLVTAADNDLAAAADLGDADRDQLHQQLAAAAAEALASLPDNQLHELAAAHGFTHPTLVSGGALTHWLNPAYPADAASKAKIATKADERYHQLAAGDELSITTIQINTRSDWYTADSRTEWENCYTSDDSYMCSKDYDFQETLTHELIHGFGTHHLEEVDNHQGGGTSAKNEAICDDLSVRAIICASSNEEKARVAG